MISRQQIEITLGLLFVLVAATFLVLIGLNEENRMAEREAQVLAASVEQGAALFETNCSPCHGVQGKGIEGVAPPLTDAHFFTNRVQEVGWNGSLEDYIMSTASAGRRVSTRPEHYVGAGVPAMPAWAQEFGGPLRPDQIRDIAKYILSWEEAALAGEQVEVLATPTPAGGSLVEQGRVVYENAGCGACHTINGISTGVVGPNLTNIGEVAATRRDDMAAREYIRQSILAPNAFVVEGFAANIMPQNFQDLLSEPDLEALIEFLLAQK